MGALAVPTGGTLSSALREQRILGAVPGINRVLWSCRQSAVSLGWHRGVGGAGSSVPFRSRVGRPWSRPHCTSFCGYFSASLLRTL